MKNTMAWGIGLATVTDTGRTLDVWYPQPHLGEMPEGGDPQTLQMLATLETRDEARGVHTSVVRCASDLRDHPASTADAYLRLHLLSHRLAKPNTMNLDGIRSRLPNVAWTSIGPCDIDNFETTRFKLRTKYGHQIVLTGVDKFPAMVNYVLPSGVSIASAARVRLGAYLSKGTIVMHAGFVNYNAGTLGRSTIEGRLAQGVTVGAGTHVGGGASTMGRVAGDANQTVRLGENCVLGSNSGLGISLGDNCVVEAGLFVTSNTKLSLMPGGGVLPGNTGSFIDPHSVPASKLAGASNVLFRRNNVTGRIEALSRGGKNIVLSDGTSL